MELMKYITRNYSLRDHVLIVQALYKKNTTMPILYYTEVADIYWDGLLDVYISPNDLEANTLRFKEAVKDKKYLSDKLKEGRKAVELLSDISKRHVVGRQQMSVDEVIDVIEEIRKKIYVFGGFFEFTHYLGRSNINLTPEQLIDFGVFHDNRKEAFLSIFNFLDSLLSEYAQINHKNIVDKKFHFITLKEIVLWLTKKVSDDQINYLHKERIRGCLCIYNKQKEKIITGDYDYLLTHLNIVDKPIQLENIVGTGINKQCVRGVVKKITQNSTYHRINKNYVIVTQMSSPEMASYINEAKALITDEGGLLCHAAIFAREMNIPCIIGTKIATQVLKDGDLVEVDADKGIVKIIKS